MIMLSGSCIAARAPLTPASSNFTGLTSPSESDLRKRSSESEAICQKTPLSLMLHKPTDESPDIAAICEFQPFSKTKGCHATWDCRYSNQLSYLLSFAFFCSWLQDQIQDSQPLSAGQSVNIGVLNGDEAGLCSRPEGLESLAVVAFKNAPLLSDLVTSIPDILTDLNRNPSLITKKSSGKIGTALQPARKMDGPLHHKNHKTPHLPAPMLALHPLGFPFDLFLPFPKLWLERW